MSLLAPALLAGLAALAIPVIIHLVQRERRRVIPFPSLMFLRRIPYQSVRRRRIRDWPLLFLRLAALLLIALAFARPFFERGALASAAARGGREVVILVDRSASMTYGDRWVRAQGAARDVVSRLGSADRATLVLFDSTAEESVRSTADRTRLDRAIGDARPGSAGTRYAPALKLAMSVLAKSPLPRREAVLVSDFQRTGWRGGEDVRFPEGTVLTPVSVASAGTENLSVASASIARAAFAEKERLTLTAAIRNGGTVAATAVPVSLQVGDAVVETTSATVPAGAAATVTFAPFTLAAGGMTAVVRAGTDAMPADNSFRAVLTPSAAVTVLLIQPEQDVASSLYLRNALAIGTSPAFVVDEVSPSRLTPAALERHAVVVLNGVAPWRVGSAALRQFVERGGGLLMVLGGDNGQAGGPSPAAGADLPGPAADTPSEARATTIGYVDYSHPVFEIFQGAHGGDFSAAHVYRYRVPAAGRGDRVLARFSDGGIAALERRLGSGRVIAWSSTLDDSWNDLALRPVFLPFVQQAVRYLSRYEPQAPWQTVGQALDLSDPARGGAAGAGVRSSPRLVLTPSGRRIEAAADGTPLRFVELDEQGFYEIRKAAQPVRVAVNLDPAESDLAPLDPRELVAAVTGHAQPTAAGAATPLTREELERRQSIWWYLLFAGLLLLAVETVVSNHVSRQSSVVSRQSAVRSRQSSVISHQPLTRDRSADDVSPLPARR